jgi:DNA mismatch endonuclease (patch repair protein)
VTDHVSKARRSLIMRAVPTKDTTPERAVRSLLTRNGYRYRLHRKDLPGTPDIVFMGRRKAIFVNGCFWHGHAGCTKGRPPRSRPEYWIPKIARNIENDQRNLVELAKLGWRVLTVWQCELRQSLLLEKKLIKFLKP